ncbi:hypothetical protein D7X87_25330 [bacterium D16-54]|nr:hypothetical protein D7X87_25330 [bacterium D16-54]RKJ09441.1 hypothetical protein D7X65_25425 [bacterium D16-56]
MAIDDNGQSYIQKNLFIIINEIKISIECFRFADIRKNRYHYFDKSGLITKLLKTEKFLQGFSF